MVICKIALYIMLLIYMTMGWMLAGGMPLYIFPMAVGYIFLLAKRSLYIHNRQLIRFLILLTLFVSWAFIGVIATEESQRATTASLGWLASMGITIYACNTLNTHKDRFCFIKFYSFLHFLGLIIGFLQIYSDYFRFAPGVYESGVAGFEGMNYLFGKNYLPIFAFASAGLVFSNHILNNWSFITSKLLVVVSITGIIISNSRSTQMGLLLGILLLLKQFKFKTSLIYSLIIISVILPILFIFGVEKWDKFLFNGTGYGDESFASRIALWIAAVNMIIDHPLFGVGGGNFRLYLYQYFPFEFARASSLAIPTVFDPHNVFIGILAEYGIPGFLFFISTIIYTIRLAWKIYKDEKYDVKYRFMAFATYLYLIMFTVDMNFHNYFNDNNIWLFYGVFYSSINYANNKGGFYT